MAKDIALALATKERQRLASRGETQPAVAMRGGVVKLELTPAEMQAMSFGRDTAAMQLDFETGTRSHRTESPIPADRVLPASPGGTPTRTTFDTEEPAPQGFFGKLKNWID